MLSTDDADILTGMLQKRDNRALLHNPPVGDNHMTTHGSNLNWAICALMAFLLIGTIVWTFITNPRRRVFHYFAIGILTIATIYYFTLASNLGSTAVPVEFRHGNIPDRTRQVFYARWIGYLLNFTLIFFALELLSGVSWANIIFTLGFVILWALMFLLGMLVRSAYKWGFFVIAIVIYALIIWEVVMGITRSHASIVDLTTHKTFTALAIWELFFMLLYPICWALSEGGNRITNDAEQIFYCILDVCSQGLFAIGLLALTRRLDFDLLRLALTEHGRIGHRYGDAMEKGAAGRGEAYPGAAPATTTAPAGAGQGGYVANSGPGQAPATTAPGAAGV